jgi:hypothetical protein
MLYLFLGQNFAVGPYAGQYKVRTLGYAYSLSQTENVDDSFLSWHWHPPDPAHPHLHVKATGPVTSTAEGTEGLHLPSGRVSVESVIRLLISEHGVDAPEGWAQVLDENEELFRKYRTWG